MLWGQWNLSADKAKNYKLYNELCNLSKYCYAMKWGLTKRNYTKYSYKYDDQKRMTESETMKWNSQKNTWENDLRICYAYQGKSITTTYYKWNSKQKAYVLVPDMTVTMDNPSL